jgi:GTPase Era involved in 16S rRNA processing
MANSYTARAYRTANRKRYAITFRHPCQMENGRPGKKVCKGLGTDDPGVAAKLETDLNSLLAREDLHSLASRPTAERIFDERIIEIFYSALDPEPTSHRVQRESLMPLPIAGRDGYGRTLFLGVTGAGKSTLLRRLIGTNTERFPSTSVNRTTTSEIEVITGRTDYSAVVTFLSRQQTQQEVADSLGNAVLKAIEASSDEVIATEFLEQSDQRFRLKYVLGAWNIENEEEEDEFLFDLSSPSKETAVTHFDGMSFLQEVVTKLHQIAEAAATEWESSHDRLCVLVGDDRETALDEIQNAAMQSDNFFDLVNEIMEQISDRFSGLPGDFVKSPTGWPNAWKYSSPSETRSEFLNAVSWFCGTAPEGWGRLLTPLVTGIRVSGPFRPAWIPTTAAYNHVFIDTQGMGHDKRSTELSTEISARFGEVDTILMVESALNAFSSNDASQVLETIASTGYTAKFAVLFTHMDAVVGDNLTTAASKREKVSLGGIRNVLDHRVARNISRAAARQLEEHLKTNTFYFAYLDPKKYPTTEKSRIDKFESHLSAELQILCETLSARCPQVLQPARPSYSFESLGQAVREASQLFQETWDARLGYKPAEGITTAPWQSIKAMTLRYAEGRFDDFWLRPIDTLISKTRNRLTRFLESPLEWEGDQLSDDEKAVIIDRMKQLVDKSLTELSKSRLWKIPQPQWQDAYRPSGPGSTFQRKPLVRSIFQHQVPVMESVSDRWAQAWVDEIKSVVLEALDLIKAEQETAGDAK